MSRWFQHLVAVLASVWMLGSGAVAANHDWHDAVMGDHHDENGCAFAVLASGALTVTDSGAAAPVDFSGVELMLPVTADGCTASFLLLQFRERAPPRASRVLL